MDVHLIMKSMLFPSLRLFCLAFLLGATISVPSLLAVTPAPSPDPYTTAVNAYVDAATKEMTVARTEIETAEKQGKKEAYAGARAVYEKCQALVTRLKTASHTDFDPTKAEYERTRATLQKKLKEAKQAHVPAASVPPSTSGH